jgi:hypothetical protein
MPRYLGALISDQGKLQNPDSGDGPDMADSTMPKNIVRRAGNVLCTKQESVLPHPEFHSSSGCRQHPRRGAQAISSFTHLLHRACDGIYSESEVKYTPTRSPTSALFSNCDKITKVVSCDDQS